MSVNILKKKSMDDGFRKFYQEKEFGIAQNVVRLAVLIGNGAQYAKQRWMVKQMDNYTATEMAYKNGYEKGYEEGKRDAVVHAKWEWFDAWDGNDTFGEWKMLRCSNCLGSEGARENAKFCSECGAIMDLE